MIVETNDERSARLFKSMWVDESGNNVPPHCTEEELVNFIDGIKDSFKKTQENR